MAALTYYLVLGIQNTASTSSVQAKSNIVLTTIAKIVGKAKGKSKWLTQLLSLVIFLVNFSDSEGLKPGETIDQLCWSKDGNIQS